MSWGYALYECDLKLAQFLFRVFGTRYYHKFIWEIIAVTGDGIIWFLVVLPIIIISILSGYYARVSYDRRFMIMYFYLCNIVDIVVIIVLKLLFQRQRPPHHLDDGRFVGPDQHSFPSGHATRVWCITTMVLSVSRVQPRILKESIGLSSEAAMTWAIVWAILVSFSRLALGRHYPSDVLAGSIVGSFLGFPIARSIMEHTIAYV